MSLECLIIVFFGLSSVPGRTYPMKGRVGPVRPRVPQDSGEWLPTIKSRDRSGPEVTRLKDGRLRYRHPSFTATVRRDGTVRFSDKLLGWNWPKEKGPPSPHPGYVVEVMPDGSVPFNPRFLSNHSGQGGGSFDLYTLIQKARGKTVNAGDKLRFLDRTRSFRLAMRRRWKLKVQKGYLTRLSPRLAALWRLETLTFAQKRRLMFLLWDECLEQDGTRTGRLAAEAREIILTFIRRYLPRGSPLAYTRAELARLNRQRESRHPFDPYGAFGPHARQETDLSAD